MKLVVFTEEYSMKMVLDALLPAALPPLVSYQVVPFNGRGDLESNVERMLRGWNEPDVKFVIVEDQDNDDCRKRKAHLANLAERAGKEALVRIACRELESWYFGDLEAVAAAYGKPNIVSKYGSKAKYRNPDAIIDVKEELLRIVPEHQQIEGARKISANMDIGRNRSRSFQVFFSGVKRLVC
ncbi:DUF4276 family protein [Enterorhabdus sp. NM05_H27]|nr:DUF4276 family protein [Enterorhabdus sp. NM05_H27]